MHLHLGETCPLDPKLREDKVFAWLVCIIGDDDEEKPSVWKFISNDTSCEGYSYPSDFYVPSLYMSHFAQT